MIKNNTHFLAVLLFATNFCFLGTIAVCAEQAPTENKISVAVETTKLTDKMLSQELTLYGELAADPDQILSVSLPNAGLINRVWVRLGQRVKQGEPLLEMLLAPEAHMQYIQAQGAVEFSLRELERKQQLRTAQLATQAELESTQKQLSDARSTLIALQQRGQDKNQKILFAPVDGIIIQLDISQGQRIAADSTALLIATQDRLIARMGVEPESLKHIKIGMPITLSSVFEPELTIESTVREIHAMINPATNLVEIIAIIPQAQSNNIVLGSRMTGFISFAPHVAKMVPRSAILEDEESAYVFKVVEHKAELVRVKPGIEQLDSQEVTGELNIDDTIVVLGNYELVDGMTVRENQR